MNIIGKKVRIINWFSSFYLSKGIIIYKSKIDKNVYGIKLETNGNILEFEDGYFTIIDSYNNYLVNFGNRSCNCYWCGEELKVELIRLNKNFSIFYCPKCLR